MLCKASRRLGDSGSMLSPPGDCVQAVEVIDASLLHRSVKDGLLYGESFVFEVVAHVNALVDAPNVNELVSTLLVGHAGDPVMSLGA